MWTRRARAFWVVTLTALALCACYRLPTQATALAATLDTSPAAVDFSTHDHHEPGAVARPLRVPHAAIATTIARDTAVGGSFVVARPDHRAPRPGPPLYTLLRVLRL